MTKIALKIEQLNQSYEDNPVLIDFSLSVNQGEYIGLVGVNGAGKTTLIKSVLDFISIKTGNIEIFGQSHRETSSRQSLSFLPEKFLPPYYLTGKDFLSYMTELNRVELKESDIEEIFKVLDLELSALKKSVRHYSKGMAQKLGLASCFLSPKARAYLKRHLVKLKETGKTLFFSTHLLADVESLCDRIVVLHNGKICFHGSPSECCNQYQADNIEDAYLNCIFLINKHVRQHFL